MNSELVLKNLKTVVDSIAELCVAHPVRLVAVSKTFPADAVLLCYQHGGQRHFGENYVQELEAKAHQLALKGANEIRWHYIGRLQSNMIRRLCAVPNLWCVETVDSAKHADALQRAIEARGDEQQQLLNVFIQVNTSGEPNKRGVRPDELLLLAKHITAQCQHLSLIGLMSIGDIAQSLGGGEENADFALLRRLRDELQVQLRLPNMLELSMGMSADYHLAIKYGSTNVRVEMSVSRPPMRQRMAQQSRVASLVMAIEQIHRQDGGRAASVAFVRAPPNVVSQRMRVLAQVYELLVRNRRATKRDLYYEHKKLYGTQINFNRALTALCKQLSASRSELHVISCSRGFAIGNLRLFDGMDDDSVVDFRASPVAIVESLCHFSLVHSEAQFLLVVEKDAIFQRLIDEQFLHKFPRGILLTGRGYPDFCTRQFLHWLSVQLPALPMLALVDADPYGVEIFLTYKYGSSRSIVEAGAFHLPRLRWLGFLPSEAQKLPIPSNQCLQLSEKDRKRIERIAQRTNGHGEEERSLFNYELSVMLNSSQKLELEALCSISANYLSTVYLDNKLLPLNVSVAQPYDGNNNVERVQNVISEVIRVTISELIGITPSEVIKMVISEVIRMTALGVIKMTALGVIGMTNSGVIRMMTSEMIRKALLEVITISEVIKMTALGVIRMTTLGVIKMTILGRRLLKDILTDGPPEDIGGGMEVCDSDGDAAPVPRFAWRKIVVRSKPLSGGASSGSSSVDMGNTRVVCTVNGPREQQQQSASASVDTAMEEGVLSVTLRGGDIEPTLRYSVERALQAVVCLRKLARTETAIELNVLSDDGGAFAACLIAAGVAVASANIEMFDVLLACNVLLIPPTSSQTSCSTTGALPPLQIVYDPDKAAIAEHAGKASALTLAVIPSIGQAVCAELTGAACPLPQRQLRRALSEVYEHCLTLYGTVRAALLKGVAEGAI
uniref:Pyridoxal phosphate homeostasis protein n=1 Tax=Globodera rostochiensis TaxID=31243 RepID=A0A914HA60_GLORO